MKQPRTSKGTKLWYLKIEIRIRNVGIKKLFWKVQLLVLVTPIKSFMF